MNGITSCRSIVVLIALLSLTACGGGGGGGGGAPAPQPTNLDTSFGANGKVVTEFFVSNDVSSGQTMAIQDDGKIVVAGKAHNGTNWDFVLARYNTDGTLDTSFNNPVACIFNQPCRGTLATDFNGSHDTAWAVVIQPDGKIVVAGETHNGTDQDFALARYNADGSLDTGFGPAGTGKVTTGFFSDQHDVAMAIALQADGKIVVAGEASNGTDRDFAVARYNANGILDSSFNNFFLCLPGLICNGKEITDFNGKNDGAEAIAIQPDGMIVLAGRAASGITNDFALARYNSNSVLDIGFGPAGTGKVTTGFFSGESDAISAIALQANGQIVVAGYAFHGSNDDFALARYNVDGTLDTGFNNQTSCVIGNPCSGQQVTDFNGHRDRINTVAIDGNDRIVVAGYTFNGSNDEFAVARYNADGSLDTGFGFDNTGTVTTGFFSGEDDQISAIALQTDGKIVAAGWASDGSNDHFALARYLP